MTTWQDFTNWISEKMVNWFHPSTSSGLAGMIASNLESMNPNLTVDRKALENSLNEAAKLMKGILGNFPPKTKDTIALIAVSLGINQLAAEKWLTKIEDELMENEK